jgi:hypothetical protein
MSSNGVTLAGPWSGLRGMIRWVVWGSPSPANCWQRGASVVAMGSPSGGHVGHTVPHPPLLQRISPQQWLALDVAFGVLLFLGGLTHVVARGHAGSHDPEWLLALLLAGASVPTMFRRRFPLAALVIVTSCVAVTTMSGASFTASGRCSARWPGGSPTPSWPPRCT